MSRIGERAADLWAAASSDIALHGLAYLGVLLTFVGVLGFLLFAFADVPNSVQPLVELFIASVFFGWAYLLRRQQASNVANALELIGGLTLPLILFAGYVDGAPIPPNAEGGVLVATMTITSLALAAAYAAIAHRRPDSTLRFLVAPLIWLGALALGFVFKTDEPLMGVAITRLVSPQSAMASVAVAAVLAFARVRQFPRFERSAMVAGLVGVPATYALTFGLATAEGWNRPASGVVVGIATIVSVHAIAGYFDRDRLAVLATPILVAAAIAPLIEMTGVAWAGVVAAVAYLVVLEWVTRSEEPDQIAWIMAAAGCAVGLAMSLIAAPATVVAFGAASLWAHWRRVTGVPIEGAGEAMTAAAALLPIGVGWAIWDLMAHQPAMLLMAAIVFVVALGVRWLDSEDIFWSLWPPAVALVIAGFAIDGTIFHTVSGEGPGALPSITLLLVATTIAIGRRWPDLRLWLASGAFATAIALALEGATASPETRALVWAIAGLAAAAIAGLSRKPLANHLAAVGHITMTGALLIQVDAEAFTAVIWSWSLGWLLSLIATARQRGSLTRLLERAADPDSSSTNPLVRELRWIVPVLFASSVPIATIATANLWAEFVANRSWTGVVLGFLAIVYATVTRRLPAGMPLRRVLAIGASALAVVGVAIAAPVPWPTIFATGSTLLVALTLAADDRQTAFSWFAWLMSGVMAVLMAERAGIAPRNLYLVSLTWGVMLLVGGLIADDVVSGRRAHGEGLRARGARYPVFIGALAVPVSLAPVFDLETTVLGWSALAAALGYFVVAALLRAGLPTAPGYALGAVAAVSLSPWSVINDPALLPVVAAVLTGVAMAAGRIQPEAAGDDAWLSWELPPLAVAHVVGAIALATAHNTAAPEITWFLLGAVSAAVAMWRRRGYWLDASIMMFIVCAGYVGLGALALALAAVSLRGLIGVYTSEGKSRSLFQVLSVSAAAASWLTVLAWQTWDLSLAVSNSALLFGLGALAVAALSRTAKINWDSSVAWGALTTVGLVGSGFVAVAAQVAHVTGTGEPGIVGLGLAIGLATFAGALEIAAKPLGRFLGYWAVVMAGAGWLAGLVGAAVAVDNGILLTSIVGGSLTVAAVELARRAEPESTSADSAASLTVSQTWALLGVLGVGTAIVVAGATVAARSTWQYGVAAGLALLSIAAARGAGTLRMVGIREASGLVGLAALVSFLYGSSASATGFVTVMVVVAAAASLTILQIAGRRADSIWLPPLQWLAIAANVLAAGIAISTIPDRPLFAIVLLAVGIQSIAVGISLHRLALLAAGPPAIAAAFVLTVAEAVSGSVQWYTTPLALVILAEVEIIRLRQNDDPRLMSTHQLSILEWSGIALLTLPAIVEMFFRGPLAGLLLFAVAALLLLWAILTRIRRRAVAAAAVATGSAVMMVTSALTLGAPDSAGFWIVAVGLGFAVMAVAGIIEAARSRQGRFVQRFDRLMDGWT